MRMDELTDYEKSLVIEARKSRERTMTRWKRQEDAIEKWRRDPVVRRDGKYTVVKESTGKHAPWGVYEGERLICFCVYRKGAFALVDYLLEKDAWCGLLTEKRKGK